MSTLERERERVPVRSGSSHPWAGISTGDVLELLANAPSRGPGGKRLRSHYARNLLDVVDSLRRSSAVQGSRIRTTFRQLHVSRGGDWMPVREAHDHAHTPLTRYLNALEEAGLIAWRGQPGEGGGLHVELLDPRLSSSYRARSSAGLSYGVTCKPRRHRESRQELAERRCRPRRRRKGAPARYELDWGAGRRSLFSHSETVPSLRSGGALKGSLHEKKHLDDAREGAAGGQGSAEGGGRVGGQARQELERQLAQLVADARVEPRLSASRAWAMFALAFGRSLPLSRAKWQRLQCDLARLDRHGGAGAGCDVLERLLLGHLDAVELGEPRPASLAFFLPSLRSIGRKWRRDHDPERRRKAAEWRAARGDRAHLYENTGAELRRGRRQRGNP